MKLTAALSLLLALLAGCAPATRVVLLPQEGRQSAVVVEAGGASTTLAQPYTEALVYPQSDGTVCAMKATAEGPKRMDCASGFGAATMVTATFGFVAVSHALKKMMAKAARQG